MSNVVPLHDDSGVHVSGGELPHGSTNVWAIQALKVVNGTKKAHFWKRVPCGYRRECDGYIAPAFLWNGQATIFGAGNFPKCKRCMKQHI